MRQGRAAQKPRQGTPATLALGAHLPYEWGMNIIPLTLSEDQAEAHDRVSAELMSVGIDLGAGSTAPAPEGKGSVLAVVGKAGSGKTMLLANLTKALVAAGVTIVSGDYEGKRRRDQIGRAHV